VNRDPDKHRRESLGGRARRDPLLGRVLAGRFKVSSLVARGGMGKIYRAEQHPLGRVVALKVLTEADGDEEFKARFFREASVCARLAHPNTVRVFDYGQTEDDVYFIAMEFIDGKNLREVLDDERILPAGRVIEIARQICGSLAEAHALGLVHRDLKPGNVLLAKHGDDDEHVKVVDFGLVKHAREEVPDVTRSGYIVGSPLYMSPEQIRGGQVGPSSDIYSLGALMYTCLTGRPPFERDNALAVLMSHLRAPPPSFDEAAPGVPIPRVLGWIVMRCLEKEPQERFSSVNEVARALRLAESELRGLVRPDLALRLNQGALDLPAELDLSLTVRPGRLGSTAPNLESSAPSLVQTISTHAMPLWGVAAMGMVALLAATILGVAGAILFASWLLDTPAAPATAAAPTPAPAPATASAPPPPTTPPPEVAPPPPPPTEHPKVKAVNAPAPPSPPAGDSTDPPPAVQNKALPPVPPTPPKEETWQRPSDIRDPWAD
jgi:serine/threonine protein kinase